ncbi:helix-turn-helix transcriptional regulator [[Mycoplasma] collis]|uniref:helix-turn-helix transcriptional regulator n=1 Tax=[Mycoplasma] collis TaxID=2127 RepID=UPI00051BC64F|nr:helix-turn-helix transcriptional regulator [[Mycoplasma] collis]
MNKQNIQKILKILSSKIKLNIIVHLFFCDCNKCNVNYLTQFFKISQPNISANLIYLKNHGIIQNKIEKKERFYFLSETFKKKYGNLIRLIVEENTKYFEKILCECKI